MATSVQVNEPVGGTWRMLLSFPWDRTGAWASAFTGPESADRTSTLKLVGNRTRVTRLKAAA